MYKIERAQREIMLDGILNPDSNKLESGLSLFASILTFFVVRFPIPAQVALSAVALGLSLVPSEKDILNSLSADGERWLGEMYDFMYDNPQYDLIEIKYPFLQYIDVNDEGEDIKFVTGRGILTKVHSSSGWIVM
ncbi:hypothetical protein TEPIDINF_000695 [Tepidibacillus infernus]|uniref:Uncharacterized protein n=1 Tax=Tepidibacillus decaturensis TaxID=1413211 RepID=A0A135L371_9BACI|nr:hypothetical protein [Tepidibacillus decaturensis]KXG43329.1 hypothetical protein U473_04340 [Tepidibacillus decaturensis]